VKLGRAAFLRSRCPFTDFGRHFIVMLGGLSMCAND
jgi:hypothetical protein